MAAMTNTDVADGSIRTRTREDHGRHDGDDGDDDDDDGDDYHGVAVPDADACVQPADWQQSFPALVDTRDVYLGCIHRLRFTKTVNTSLVRLERART